MTGASGASERPPSGLTSSAGPREERAGAEQRRREDGGSAEERSEQSNTAGEGWHQLHPRTVPLTALTVAGILGGIAVPVVIGISGGGDVPFWLLIGIAVVAILVVSGLAAVADLMRWRHTTYRVTDERIELRYAWVLHKLRSVPRERVRTVDLTANPLYRALGVARVKIGTGQQTSDSSHVTLDPVGKVVAEELRRLLLNRTESVAETSAGPEIATLDWRWLRYAPISVTTPILGAAAFGAVMQASEWFNLQGAVFRTVRDSFGGLSIIGLIAVLIAAAVVVGFVGSLGLFVEMWYRYKLVREGGNLLMTRGLLNTRSLTLERRRLRGVEVIEPLGARMLGAARVDVVATGMASKDNNDKTDPKTVLPPAPYDTARRVAAEVLGSPAATATAVRGHPRPALWRRVRWGLYSVLSLVFVLALLGFLLTDVLTHIAWISAVVLTPVAVFLAFEAYRNLGHGLAEKHLVTRYGVGARRTVALLRSGVIGWRITSSPFQRRAGLVTLYATTAASKGAYPVYDVGIDDGLTFAADAVPDLLRPFLEPQR